MKQRLPLVITGIFALWILGALVRRPDRDDALGAFGRLPVVFNGRLQPIDSLARNSLTRIREKDTANLEPAKSWHERPRIITATEWLLTVMTRPEVADGWKVFRVDHPELKALLKLPEPNPPAGEDGKHYSWNQFGETGLKQIEDNARNIQENKKDSSQRNAFDNAILGLYEAMTLYLRLKNTVHPQDTVRFADEIAAYRKTIPAGVEAFRQRMSGAGAFDTNALTELFGPAERYFVTLRGEPPLLIPPAAGGDSFEWQRVPEALLDASFGAPLLKHLMRIPKAELPAEAVTEAIRAAGTRPLHPAVGHWAAMADAFRGEDTGGFNAAVAAYRGYLESLRLGDALAKAGREQRYNAFAPFSKAAALYLVAFLFGCGFWFNFAEWTRKTSLNLVRLAFVVHTLGLLVRMWLEGRPPVTNLYSSAIFIGWGAVGLGWILESFWKNAIGLAVATVIGFSTQIVAHLGLGSQGERGPHHRALECAHPARPLGRDGSRARHHEPGHLREHRHELVVVRHQPAGRGTPQLRLHERGLHGAHGLRGQPVRAHRAGPRSAGEVAEFRPCHVARCAEGLRGRRCLKDPDAAEPSACP